MKSARADSERFYFLRKFGKSRNPVCISDFSNCTERAKGPLLSRRRFIQRLPSNYTFICPAGNREKTGFIFADLPPFSGKEGGDADDRPERCRKRVYTRHSRNDTPGIRITGMNELLYFQA